MEWRTRGIPKRIATVTIFLAVVLLAASCVDPVEPEFRYRTGLVYIDGLIGTEPGSSYVEISISAREFGLTVNNRVSGASVFFIETDSETSIPLQELEGVYLPPDSFFASVGQTWELRVVMPDGSEYRSEPENLLPAVPVSNVDVNYDPELLFSDAHNANIPGHQISVDFRDPQGIDNYYYWRYRSFERLVNCKECYNQTVYRNGECRIVNRTSDNNPTLEYYTYACEEWCWQIRYSDKISIFSDEFTDGGLVTALPVADIVLFTRRDILVELRQFSISQEAYRYLKTLKDLIDNNSGFNAPLPSALIGNLYNPADTDEVVLGRLTTASTTVSTVFIDRTFIEEEGLEPILVSQAEGLEAPPPIVTSAPCIDGRYRTSARPDDWPENL